MTLLSIWRGPIPCREPMAAIIAHIAREHGLTSAQVSGTSTVRPIAHARQHAMAVMREAGWSTGQIGRALRRDHSTVIHGARAHLQRSAAA